jgi:hypothetical protein
MTFLHPTPQFGGKRVVMAILHGSHECCGHEMQRLLQAAKQHLRCHARQLLGYVSIPPMSALLEASACPEHMVPEHGGRVVFAGEPDLLILAHLAGHQCIVLKQAALLAK